MVNELQKQFEDRHVTCTCVCMNWRQEREEEAFSDGCIRTVRKHILEIDRCRPFFVGILGDRYGFVPSLVEHEERWPHLSCPPPQHHLHALTPTCNPTRLTCASAWQRNGGAGWGAALHS